MYNQRLFSLCLLVEEGGNYNGGAMNSEFLGQTRNVKRDIDSSSEMEAVSRKARQTQGKITVRACIDIISNRTF